MNIRFRSFRRYLWIGSIFAVPAALFDMYYSTRSDNSAWVERLGSWSFVSMFLFCASGAMFAILTRVGFVQFLYSPSDKITWIYKISKEMAERERRSAFGATFSKRYFESFDLDRKCLRETDKPTIVTYHDFLQMMPGICIWGFALLTILPGIALTAWGSWLLLQQSATVMVNGVPSRDPRVKAIILVVGLAVCSVGVLVLYAKPFLAKLVGKLIAHDKA